jgi:hypothetical protein
VNEAVRGAQAFDLSAGKPFQYLSQPGIGRTQERILRGGVSQIGETRHVCNKRNACKADSEVVTCHDQREERNAWACERESRVRGLPEALVGTTDVCKFTAKLLYLISRIRLRKSFTRIPESRDHGSQILSKARAISFPGAISSARCTNWRDG